MKILVINGPNLNFLGIREKSVYGTENYQYLLDMIAKKAEETGNEITVFQSNHEGAIIDRLQEAYFDGTEGIATPLGMLWQVSQCRKWRFTSPISPSGKNSARFP